MKLKYLLLITTVLFFNSCKKDKDEDRQASIDFTYTGNSTTAPVTVSFTAQPSDDGTVEWDFGDGTKGTGVSITHVYNNVGFYIVSATLVTSYGSAGKNKFVNASANTRMRIYQIEGTAPSLKPDGTSWDNDLNTSPDLYFKIYNTAGVDLTGGAHQVFTNTYTVIYPFNPAIDITDFESVFKVEFLDSDVGGNDELIVKYNFLPTDYLTATGAFPMEFTKSDPGNGTTVTVKVAWSN
ncbi:MAG: PKD domain-containing protein [Bacteroidota bacterium]